MKRILFLGGSTQQIPAIQYAKENGYYTILCDYLIDNPGQNYSEEFHCVSTTDKEVILSVAKESRIDGIVAYASDPAAPTAAYVGNKLNLPSNPYESVLILSRKDLFRKFLKENGFNCPKVESFQSLVEVKEHILDFCFPLMVKPIDSSGSKGVSRIDSIDEVDRAFEHALSNSREKKVIIEEYIEMAHEYMIGGDGFVIDGKLEFCGFLNCHRNKEINPYIPVGKSYPLLLNANKIELARNEIQRVLDLLNFKMGALNLELMFDKEGNLYIIEIGPRNGGNMIPDLLKISTGVDLISATVEASLDNCININTITNKEGFYSTYILHSSKKGKLKDIVFKKDIENNIVDKVIYKEIGSDIEIFDGANKALGILFLQFDNFEELKYKMVHMNQFIDIQVI